VRLASALGAVPSPRSACLRFLLSPSAGVMAPGVVMPADLFELPDRSHARHDGRVSFSADLGARRATGVAEYVYRRGVAQAQPA
jgi:hypothetical protein